MAINRRWILLVVLLVGCGYRAAMERADAAHERKDWAEAAAGYEAALQHDPDDEDATRGLIMAQRRWHTQSLSRFEKSLSDGDLPAAHAALRQAEAAQPSAPANTIAHRRLATAEDARQADALRTRARAQQDQGQPLDAMRLWAQAQAVHATAAGATALKAARAAIVDRASAAEAAGQWVDADAGRAAIAEIDPKAQSAYQALRDRWAAAWRADAVAHMAEGRDGVAIARAAQVAAISGQPDDIARRDAWRTRFIAGFALRAEVAVAGASGRAAAIEAALPTSASVDPASAALVISGQLAPVRFTQSKSVEVESARYQSGTRTEANPEWVTGRNAVRAARRRQRTAEGALRSAEDDLRGAEVAVQADREQRSARVRKRRRRLRKALAQARAEEQRCQSAVRDAPDTGRANARSRLDRAQRSVDDAWRALDALAGDRDDQTSEVRAAERAHRHLEGAREFAARARQAASDAERDLDRLAPTVETPRYATHRYPVEVWTRAGEGSLVLDVRLPDLPPESVPLTAQARTRDRSHDAQMPLGLSANRLRFPYGDVALTRAVDADLGKMLAQAVAAQEARWARSLVTRALAAPTPAGQVRFAVAAVLMRNASPDTISRARTILEARVDLRDVTILRAGLR